MIIAPAVAFAAVRCTEVLQAVRTEGDGKVMVRFNDSWHNLASSSHPARRDRMSLATAALLSGNRLMVRYEDGYSCTVDDFSEEPTQVELQR